MHTYPKGSYTFHTITDTLNEEPMGPTTWDANVYIVDSSVEEREEQILNSSIITEQLKSVLSSVAGKTINKTKFKPHQPKFETNKVFVTSISDTDLLT